MSFENILQQAQTPADMPIVATISGDAGIGKTTFACTFPRPIVIRLEDGLQSIPYHQRPAALPLVTGVDMLLQQLTAIAKGSHNFQTLILDSVTQLDEMFIKHVVDNDSSKPKSINQAAGGYGGGMRAVAALHQRVRKAAEICRTRGMHVVFIAHSSTSKVEPPDAEPYTRYDLRLHTNCQSPYVDNVDLVGYLKLEMYGKKRDGEDIVKVVSDGTRILSCHTQAANVSKNRYGIEEDLYVERGENPLYDWVPSLAATRDALAAESLEENGPAEAQQQDV